MMSKITEEEKWKPSEYWKRVTCIRGFTPLTRFHFQDSYSMILKHLRNDTKRFNGYYETETTQKFMFFRCVSCERGCPDSNLCPLNFLDCKPVNYKVCGVIEQVTKLIASITKTQLIHRIRTDTARFV